MSVFKIPPPLEKIEDEWLVQKTLDLAILRLDLIHPIMGGNKYFKLKYNLKKAQEVGQHCLLTFGGAYSNHIYATAALAQLAGMHSIGIIRGEAHQPLNPTLAFAQSCGMRLEYMDRERYRKKNNPEVIAQLRSRLGDFYLIPEGGSNPYALLGCQEILNFIGPDVDYICLPCGTGGTLAGMLSAAPTSLKILGFPVLKGGDFLYADIERYRKEFRDLFPGKVSDNQTPANLHLNYHFGGYAKNKPELKAFIKRFQDQHGIELEWIYSGKMMFGLYDLIGKNYFPKGSRIVALHCGGLR